MMNRHFSSRRARDRAEDEAFLDARFCNVAAAIIGSAAIGAVGSAMSAPDTPDNGGMNRAAESQAALSKEQLDWSKEIYRETAPDRARATQIAFEQAGLQTEAARRQLAQADESLAYQRSTFRPAEQKLVAAAMGFDTPARREEAARAAAADVEMQFAGARQATMREMERRGALPSSGRVMALQGMQDIALAKAKVSAANGARREIESLGTARLGDVANLGRGIASNQVAQLQSGLQAGNSAVGNGQVPVNVAAAGAGIMQQGFAGAQQSMASAGSLFGQAASIQNQSIANNNQMWSGAGTAIGQIAASRGLSGFNFGTPSTVPPNPFY